MKTKKLIYILAVAISVVTASLWAYTGLPTYYIGDASSDFLLHVCIFLLIPKPRHWIFISGLFLSWNKFTDEIFGNPTEFNTFEYVNASVMILFFIIRHIYRKQKHY